MLDKFGCLFSKLLFVVVGSFLSAKLAQHGEDVAPNTIMVMLESLGSLERSFPSHSRKRNMSNVRFYTHLLEHARYVACQCYPPELV